MKLFDLVLFYHSNCKPPGIVGVARVVREGYVDHTAFDRTHPHYDPKSDPSMPPKWFMVAAHLQILTHFRASYHQPG